MKGTSDRLVAQDCPLQCLDSKSSSPIYNPYYSQHVSYDSFAMLDVPRCYQYAVLELTRA